MSVCMCACMHACVSVCTIGDCMYAPPTLKGLAGQTKDCSLPRKSSSSSSFSSRLGERGARVSPHHTSLSRCFRTWVHQWEAYRAVTSHTVLATAANVMVENEAYNSQLRVATSSPDLIRRVYRFQYNARGNESDPCWGWFWVWDRD